LIGSCNVKKKIPYSFKEIPELQTLLLEIISTPAADEKQLFKSAKELSKVEEYEEAVARDTEAMFANSKETAHLTKRLHTEA